MQINVEIKNIGQIRKALNDSPAIVKKYIDTAIKRSIFQVEREAVPLTPVDTGRLRGSYEIKFETFGGFQPIKGILEPTAFYAIFVEEGTRRMRAQPYLHPGLQNAMPEINKEFGDGLEEALKEITSEANK
jgi:HK97 gp10 family phage protein